VNKPPLWAESIQQQYNYIRIIYIYIFFLVIIYIYWPFIFPGYSIGDIKETNGALNTLGIFFCINKIKKKWKRLKIIIIIHI